jgi:glucose 1-dehydrogenase
MRDTRDRLKDKHVLVTGGTTGIGKAVARRFAREGASVAINYLGPEVEDPRAVAADVQAARHAEDIKTMTVQADISKAGDIERMFAEVLNDWKRLDVLVNNAGMEVEKPSHELTAEDVDKVVDVDLRGACLCAVAALRHFLSRPGGGVILNNSSVHEEIPKPKYLPYSIAKGGMRNLTRTLALEYASRGIRVNAVGPGVVETRMNSQLSDPDARERVRQHIPMREIAEPDEIAAVFAFLASDEARYITGQTVMVDGGLNLYPDFRQDWSSP